MTIPNIRVYPRGRRFWIRFSWHGEDLRWPAGPSRSDAETLRARIILAIEEGRFHGRKHDVAPVDAVVTVAKAVTLRGLCDEYLRRHADHRKSSSFYYHTVKAIERGLREHLSKPVSGLTPKHVSDFVTQRYRQVKRSTANRSLTVLKQMLNYAVDWGYIDKSPAEKFRLEREQNRREFFLSGEEFEALLGHIPEWLRPTTLAAAYTGGRRGELLGLTWDEVDLKRRTLCFRDTKNGEDRFVPISRRLFETLSASTSRFDGGSVFRDRTGNPLRPKQVSEPFVRAVRAADLRRSITDKRGQRHVQWLTFHDLRHTFASWQVQAGVPLNTVRELLGHKSIEMTLRYSHLAPRHLKIAAEVLDAMDSSRQRDESYVAPIVPR